MKRLSISLIVLSVFISVAVYSFHIVRLSQKALTAPVSIYVDFSTKGIVWKRRTLRSVAGEPVAKGELSQSQLSAVREYAVKKYGSSSLSFFCARSLSRILAEERPGVLPPVRAADELLVTLYLHARYDERTLSELFFSRKTVLRHCVGLPILARTAYGRDLKDLSQEQFLSLLRFYCAPSRKNISADLYAKINSFASSFAVKNDLSSGGTAADYCERELRNAGVYPPQNSIIVDTTIDPVKQKSVEEKILKALRNFDNQPLIRKTMLRSLPPIEGAALIIDVRTGDILAMAGGIKYSTDNRLNRCESRRQISSTFKPFLYAQAFEDGICTPETVFTDKPVTMKNRDGSIWEPKNYYPYFIGDVKARDALSLSVNTVSVQLIDKIGVSRMTDKARRIFRLSGSDLSSRISAEPSLSLGSIDLSPLELAKGYLVLAAGGEEHSPSAVLRVSDVSGNILWENKKYQSGVRLFRKETCRIIIPILQNVIRTGTASKFISHGFDFDAAGKSGSSPSDSWFAGFNPETLIVVWAGYDVPSWSKAGKIPEFSVIPFWYSLMSEENPLQKKF